MGKGIPGGSAGTVVLTHRAPLPLGEIRPPALPVRRLLLRFLQPYVFGGHDLFVFHWLIVLRMWFLLPAQARCCPKLGLLVPPAAWPVRCILAESGCLAGKSWQPPGKNHFSASRNAWPSESRTSAALWKPSLSSAVVTAPPETMA